MDSLLNSFQLNDILKALNELGVEYGVNNKSFDNSVIYSFKSLKKIEPKGIYYISTDAEFNLEGSIIIASGNRKDDSNVVILVEDDPQLVFYKLMELFFKAESKSGIHPTAITDELSVIHPSAYIGPYCVVEGAFIDAGVNLHSHVVVMKGSHISKNVIVESHSTIGATGVAWIWDQKNARRVKQPQIGNTYIGQDTFLGSDISIVRGSVNETTSIGANCVIAHGSKIGHGSVIGNECHFANNISIAGNVALGEKCFLGAGAVVRPNTRLANGTIVGAGAVVVKNCTTPNLLLMGMPAKPVGSGKKTMSGVPKPLEKLKD